MNVKLVLKAINETNSQLFGKRIDSGELFDAIISYYYGSYWSSYDLYISLENCLHVIQKLQKYLVF